MDIMLLRILNKENYISIPVAMDKRKTSCASPFWHKTSPNRRAFHAFFRYYCNSPTILTRASSAS